MLPEQTLGKYRLIRRVGVGGMAEVFEAVLEGSEGFARRVALKVLLPESQRDPDVVTMFIDEAKLVARLDHPNIVSVLDFGEAGGKHFMAMEYIDGWDLGHLLQLGARAGRRFSVDGAAFIVRELCRGLDHVHRAEEQVVHRDVTPQNVFVTRRGQVKLGDFGIARSAGRLTRTEDGRIKGKLPYLAPEQVAGDPVTPRTDVYAAGLILFELLSGRRLITAERDVELLQAALHPPAVDLAAERPEAAAVEAALRQALEHHPTMRQASAAVLAADLEAQLGAFDAAALAGEVAGLTADQPAPGPTGPEAAAAEGRSPHTRVMEPAARRGSSRPWGIVVALLLVAAVAGAVGLVAGLRGGEAPPAALDGAPPDGGVTLPDVGVPDAHAAPDAPGRDLVQDLPRRRPRRPPRPARDATAPTPDIARIRADAARPVPDRVAIKGELERLVRLGRSRGLFPGDDPAVDRLAGKAGQGEPGALAGLRARVEAFRIDRAFVRAKMARLERAIAAAKLSADEQRRMTAVSQRILHLIMEEQLVEASRLMSATRAQLRSR